MSDLLNCINWSEGYCITKLIEVILSGLLFLIIFTQMILFCKQRWHYNSIINFITVIQVLMLTSLTFNFIGCLKTSSFELLYTQLYIDNIYFLTICCFLATNLFKFIKKIKIWTIIIYCCFLFAYTGVFLHSILLKSTQCQQIFYVLISASQIILFIFIFTYFKYHQKQQMNKILEIINLDSGIGQNNTQNNNHANNILHQQQSLLSNQSRAKSIIRRRQPLLRMWLFICINIFCQCVNLIETSYLYIHQNQNKKCQYSDNQLANAITNIIFTIFGYYFAFAITIYIFHLKRIQFQISIVPIKSKSDFSCRDIQRQNNVQMISNGHYSHSSGNTNFSHPTDSSNKTIRSSNQPFQ